MVDGWQDGGSDEAVIEEGSGTGVVAGGEDDGGPTSVAAEDPHGGDVDAGFPESGGDTGEGAGFIAEADDEDFLADGVVAGVGEGAEGDVVGFGLEDDHAVDVVVGGVDVDDVDASGGQAFGDIGEGTGAVGGGEEGDLLHGLVVATISLMTRSTTAGVR